MNVDSLMGALERSKMRGLDGKSKIKIEYKNEKEIVEENIIRISLDLKNNKLIISDFIHD